ncbi:MAG: DUF4382 domain-containing protein [Gemmatimonadales bacterium]
MPPRRLLPCVPMLAALVACSDSGSQDAGGTGTTRVLLSDAPFPFDRVARVDVYIVSVSGSLGSDTSAAGTFVALAAPHRSINLLALQNGVFDELGRLDLPPGGIITAVRLVIDTDSSSITLKDGRVLTGASTPGIAWQSSEGRPTLNALIQEQILIPDAGGTVAIDFDVGKAFIPPQELDPTSTDEGFIFSPVLRAADGTRTGSIVGRVSSGGLPVTDASLRLYLGDPGGPENTWSVLGTAHTSAAGVFGFSFVTRSDYWSGVPAQQASRYIVAVDPPSGLGAGRVLVPDVAVAAGQATDLGTIPLP